MQKHRGMESGYKAAEAFIRHVWNRTDNLP
jgi:hypothetical protein